ncbi:hypothetical protein GCM10011344_11050 [Dokdonia pacifica]|uniref:CHAT domain-containing protein n=1 Tax=Dokdonia pacifica TaxID=1627892 RepID=A0A238YJ19_9FLAO|nr:CHAT domain-containing protein [Dokdonia pacifica]GGG12160.1 hypothetical protein GCM10011344_11050 [Dokdonia pacifica]SNR70798.1 hypothetical protein SAMN06265376_10291 [Dokdonia pacifica]
MKKILFIKINPIGTVNLRLDEEEKALRQVLDLSIHRDIFTLESRGAVTTDDLHQYLELIKPTILHISGHGSEEGVLFFHDSEGHKKEVSILKFYEFLKNFDSHIDSVFLNACFSMSGIDTITSPNFHIIGMKEEVPNDTALAFARAFYTSHCNGKSVTDAFETAKGVVGMDGFNDELIPKHIKSNIPDQEFLKPEKVEVQPVVENQAQKSVSLVSPVNVALVKKNRIKDKRFYYIIIAVLVATSAALVLSSLSLEDKSILFTSIGSLPLFTLKWPFDKLESIKKALESILILENELQLSHEMTDEEKRTLNNQFRRIVEAKI